MYELTVILSSKLADNKQKAILEKLEKTATGVGGSFELTEKWGKRGFTFPIDKEHEGTYYFIRVNLAPDKIASFARLIENDDQILRHLIVKAQKEKTPLRSKATEGQAEKETAEAESKSKKTAVKKTTKKSVKKKK